MTGEGATRALIRAVTPELEVGGLDEGWCPTGAAWLGESAPGGVVTWVAVTTEPGG
jgi:hypothetical protein